jgi:hypothetical protein
LIREFVAPYDREVIRAAREAGQRLSYHTCGGYILSPSDHFFDADPGLLRAFAQEAVACV